MVSCEALGAVAITTEIVIGTVRTAFPLCFSEQPCTLVFNLKIQIEAQEEVA